ncbi:MAG: amino acid ABC transporter substrate-binding protein, partial [Dolichospermum sp.]|nr:amino acid ABC transporter substrate-binding protein [Dolichospermum sp.]
EEEWLENLIRTNIIENWQAKDEPEHLRTIERRILIDEQMVGELLDIYQKIYQQREIVSQNTGEEGKLQLSGLVVKINNYLQIYNLIYREVFNQQWIDNQLADLRPYSESLNDWVKSDYSHKHLLKGKVLKEATVWAKDKRLSSLDKRYLDDSQKLEYEKNLKNVFASVATGVVVGLIGAFRWYQYKYASCSIGERIEGSDKCVRNIITSGEQSKIFIDDINFHLDKGSEYFKKGYGYYQKAEKFFYLATEANRNDPIPQIYLNNTKARSTGKRNPLKLAVVTGIDFYGSTSKEIFRGVADSQDEFNKSGGKNGRLLEIVIANDGNEPQISKKVAEKLVNESDILGIIGHHASESSEVAIPIYRGKKLAIVSPTSSSSKLKDDVFFRVIQTTTEAAKLYAKYIKNTLHSDSIAIFYDQKSVYSQSLQEDFIKAFQDLGGKVDINNTSVFDWEQTSPTDIDVEINNNIISNQIKTVFLIPSVKTNSILRAFARASQEKTKNLNIENLNIIFAMSVFEQPTLDIGGDAVEGASLATPCVNKTSLYMKDAIKRWQQKTIYWRTMTGYDATQAFIGAINKSSNEPTRSEILKNLKTLTLPVEKTSGYGLNWSKENGYLYQSNINSSYCMYKIENGQFKEVLVK